MTFIIFPKKNLHFTHKCFIFGLNNKNAPPTAGFGSHSLPAIFWLRHKPHHPQKLRNMKTPLPIFLIFLLLFPTASTKAQPSEFAPIGAKWWYGTFSIPDNPFVWCPNEATVYSYEKYEVTGDTIINGESYRVVSTENPLISYYLLLVRQDGDVVYRYHDGMEYILYDFGKTAGETWSTQVTYLNVPEIEMASVTVDSVYERFISGTNFSIQVVSIGNPGTIITHDIITNVGGALYFFAPSVYDGAEPCDYHHKLRCFEYNGQTWVFDDEFACEETFSTGINDTPPLNVELTLLPSNILQIGGMEQYNNARITLYDLNGRNLFQQQLPKTQVQSLVLPDLTMGVYIIRLVAEEGVYGRKVLLGK